MNRRHFLSLTALAALAPAALAADTIPYSPGLVDRALANGETVFIDFGTDWCTTCGAQRRNMAALRDANPAYDEAITFVSVDWDKYQGSELSRRLEIPRRSTLVVLHGDEELGRIVASTRRATIQELMDTALAASTS